jgi:hypothetical protein
MPFQVGGRPRGNRGGTMAEVIHMRIGDPLPKDGDFLVLARVSRIRGFDYFIDPSPSLEPKLGQRVPAGGPGYASLATALKEAQALAGRFHVPAIYVQDQSVLVRPFYPGGIKPT